MLLMTLLIVMEVFVNIWLYYFYRCDFEDNEIFKNVNPEINRKICLESLEYDFSNQKVACATGTMHGGGDVAEACGGFDDNVIRYNSERFRGPEFTKDKDENMFRIFTVGGSTTFGSGVLDNQTYPYYLQEFYDEANLDFKVEVINAGIPGAWSEHEVRLIKNRLLALDPDLFIIFDGWNELNYEERGHEKASPIFWKNRWIEICDLGEQQGFDTIISIQPSVNFGKKILTVQEYEHYLTRINTGFLDSYPFYVEQLEELKNHCTLTADLRDIFDDIEEPIFFDRIHTGPRGNQIIAQTLYSLSLPIVMKGEESIELDIDYETGALKETNVRLNSNEDENGFIEKVSMASRDIISSYKTPKVFSLIFEK